MNFTKLPTSGNTDSKSLGQNAVGQLSLENIDGKWLLVMRPNPYRLNDKNFMTHFKAMGEACKVISSPRILQIGDFIDDEKGGYYLIGGHSRYMTLGQLLMERPEIVADQAWVTSFTNDLQEALAHLHDKHLYAIELTPLSVLVSKGSQHQVVLMPPCSIFDDIRHEVWTRETEYLAPEIFSEMPVDGRADIYATAQLLKRIFKLTSTPYIYKRFIQDASQKDPNKRPQTTDDMAILWHKSKMRGRLLTGAAWVGVVALVIGLFCWSYSEPKTERPIFSGTSSPTDSNVYELRSDRPNMIEEEVDAYLNDTTYLSEDTAYSLSPERKAHEREMMAKAEQVFKKRFTHVARAILAPVYTKERLLGDAITFRQESTRAIIALQEQQDVMVQQFKLDPTSARIISTKVINEVTDELKREALSQ